MCIKSLHSLLNSHTTIVIYSTVHMYSIVDKCHSILEIYCNPSPTHPPPPPVSKVFAQQQPIKNIKSVSFVFVIVNVFVFLMYLSTIIQAYGNIVNTYNTKVLPQYRAVTGKRSCVLVVTCLFSTLFLHSVLHFMQYCMYLFCCCCCLPACLFQYSFDSKITQC